MNKLYLHLLVIIFFTNIINGQGFVYNGTQFYNETKEFIKSPLHWQGKDLIVLGAVSSLTFGLTYADEPIRARVLASNFNYRTPYFELGRHWGEPYMAPIIGTLFLIHGSAKTNKLNQRIGFEIIQSYTYTAFVTGVLKIGFGRARPYTNEHKHSFHPFYFSSDSCLSLPSGHSSLAVALSTVLALNSKDNLVKVIAMIPAALTMTSRIVYNKHWLSDTFLGASIGFFIAKYVHQLHGDDKLPNLANEENIELFNLTVPLF